MLSRSITFHTDPLTRMHMTYAAHVAETLFGGAKNPAILRRAMAHYVEHLETLVGQERDSPACRLESSLLEKAGHMDYQEVPVGAITVLPLRKLSEILGEKEKGEQPPMDWLTHGWAAYKQETEKQMIKRITEGR